jgi:tetratricopeptide (TPR) repeat protein
MPTPPPPPAGSGQPSRPVRTHRDLSAICTCPVFGSGFHESHKTGLVRKNSCIIEGPESLKFILHQKCNMVEETSDELRKRGIAAIENGNVCDALEIFEMLFTQRKDPSDEKWRGLALQLLGRYGEACECFQRRLNENPSDAYSLHQLAHLKACCEDDSVRDGRMAVELSTRLCELTKWKSWSDVSVLAAAHAEVEDWRAAQRFASLAWELAPADEKDRREKRLEQYKERRKYRSSGDGDRSSLIRTQPQSLQHD